MVKEKAKKLNLIKSRIQRRTFWKKLNDFLFRLSLNRNWIESAFWNGFSLWIRKMKLFPYQIEIN